MSILIIGATGLVGRELVRLAVERADIPQVTALVRRDPGARPLPKVRYRVVDFDHLGQNFDDLFAVDTVLSAMGTTARATPDPARYRQIEVEIPLAVARRAQAAGATRFGLVSSVGASPAAHTTYLRQKGELEEALEKMGWARLVIARPSVLAGERDEFRLGERLGLLAGRFFPAAYRPVHASQVAAGLLDAVLRGGPSLEILDNVALRTGNA